MEQVGSIGFWESLLSINPDFAGFGNPFSEICFLSDAFLIPPMSDELEVSFLLDKVCESWKQWVVKDILTSDITHLIPDFAIYHTYTIKNQFCPNIPIESCFFLPLTTHFYFGNELAWKQKVTEKLMVYKELIQSFSKIFLWSRFLNQTDFDKIIMNYSMEKSAFTRLHFP